MYKILVLFFSSEYGGDMKEAAWYDLVSRYPEAKGMTVGDINGFKRKMCQSIKLRTSYKKMNVPQSQSIPYLSIHEKTGWSFYGHSTIQNIYELKTINNDKVVIDHATGLMWFQSGSNRYLSYDKAVKLLVEINKEGYAGFNDWRLPTLEEAFSMMEEDKKKGLFIDPIFNKDLSSIWTGDRYTGAITWCVAFDGGSVSWGNYGNYGGNYIRPVRSLK